MKHLRGKEDLEKALQLSHLIEQRKFLEKQETALKDYFKTKFEDEALVAGNLLITMEECERTVLDRVKLELALGDKIHKFETTTTYRKLEIKRTA